MSLQDPFIDAVSNGGFSSLCFGRVFMSSFTIMSFMENKAVFFRLFVIYLLPAVIVVGHYLIVCASLSRMQEPTGVGPVLFCSIYFHA